MQARQKQDNNKKRHVIGTCQNDISDPKSLPNMSQTHQHIEPQLTNQQRRQNNENRNHTRVASHTPTKQVKQ